MSLDDWAARKCIELWIEDIDNENILEFFNKCILVARLTPEEFTALVNILAQADIDTTKLREQMLIDSLDDYIENVDDWTLLDDVLKAAHIGNCFAINSFDRRCELVKNWADTRNDVDYTGYGHPDFAILYIGD